MTAWLWEDAGDMKDFRTLVPLLGRGDEPETLRHVRVMPSREAEYAPWPEWLHPDARHAWGEAGIHQPYRHQVEAANLIHTGHDTIIATGTASGKSLAYLMPVLDALTRGARIDTTHHDAGARAPHNGAASPTPAASVLSGGRGEATALYIAPTKALAGDQLTSIEELGVPGVRAATYDGDTPPEERRWVRDHANFLLTNPDMLQYGILPNHTRWAPFLRKLTHIVVDEAHSYRGVFGSHVAVLLRRLLRIAEHYGADVRVVGASATSAEPAATFTRLTGREACAVTQDTSETGETTVVLWEPPLTDQRGENGVFLRRSLVAETADLLANLVSGHVRTLAFIRSRRGAEAISASTRRLLEEVDDSLPGRIAAYRSGYLPQERRALEDALRSGELLGVASTSALELGIDIAGLDAVLVAGWPGTRASFFQQIGRAGRGGQESLATFIAGDDPLDAFLVHHPETLLDSGVEASVFDPSNPYVLQPHLAAAAAELPLTVNDMGLFGDTARELVEDLEERGILRRRPSGWFWVHAESAHEFVDLRSVGGGPMQVIDSQTGAVIATMDSSQAHYQAHEGAVYLHQGKRYVVDVLDEENHVVLATAAEPDFYTQARDVTSVKVLDVTHEEKWGEIGVYYGDLLVTTQVVSFQRKALISNEILSEEPLELEPRELFTKGVWFTIPEPRLHSAGVQAGAIPGSLHAAEHAAIGLLPLLVTSDRWDIGGVSTAMHIDTESPTIFVYDGHAGGAGFTERAHAMAPFWLEATRDAIRTCECSSGCPSCVQSPKCGNKNNPLDKAGAIALLSEILRFVPAHRKRR